MPASEMLLKRVLGTLPTNGWCTAAKATRMADLVAETKPAIAVEIGVFHGDSLFVIAQAMRDNGVGKAYGIDTWDAGESIKGMVPDGPNAAWWSKLDMEGVYLRARGIRGGLGLNSWCELIRSRSDAPETLAKFAGGSIGFFHLDGNHGPQSLADVQAWLPKLAPGATIFFDDPGWVEGGVMTTRPAMLCLIENGCTEIGAIYDPNGSVVCVILQR